jgi:hypothetical protein
MLVGTRRAASAGARVAWAVLGCLAAASCNPILGLDPVREIQPDAGSDADVDAGSCGTAVLWNGDFDLGDLGWTRKPGANVVIRRDDAAVVPMVSPQTPRFLARLGGGADDVFTVSIEQGVTVPRDARQLTLSGYVAVVSDEPRTKEFDVARAEMLVNDSPLSPILSWSNLDAVGGWAPFSATFDATTVAGQAAAVFRLIADLDADHIASYFFFDTVSLTVTACAP